MSQLLGRDSILKIIFSYRKTPATNKCDIGRKSKLKILNCCKGYFQSLTHYNCGSATVHNNTFSGYRGQADAIQSLLRGCVV